MTTTKPPGSSPAQPNGVEHVGNSAGNSAGGNSDIGYAGVGFGSDEVPSFWSALCRYRQRHGLIDPQRRPEGAKDSPVLVDADLGGLRDPRPARDFSFDDTDPTST